MVATLASWLPCNILLYPMVFPVFAYFLSSFLLVGLLITFLGSLVSIGTMHMGSRKFDNDATLSCYATNKLLVRRQYIDMPPNNLKFENRRF